MEEILHQAERLEKEYDWLGAAESYKKALTLLSEDDFSREGDIGERLGYAFYRAAFQAESKEEFGDRLRQSAGTYGKAIEFYGRQKESVKTARTSRCNAMIAYIGYWLGLEAQEKKKKIDECWKLTKDSLEAFRESGEGREYGKTFNQLSTSALLRFDFEKVFQARQKIAEEALKNAERAIALLASVGDSYELAKTYGIAMSYANMWDFYFTSTAEGSERNRQRGRLYCQKGFALSEEATLLGALSAGGWGIVPHLLPVEDSAHFAAFVEKALDFADKTKDRFLVGFALDHSALWIMNTTADVEDPDKRMEIARTALQYAERSRQQFSLIFYVSGRGDWFWTGAPHAEYHQILSREETDLQKRRDLLENAVVEGIAALKLAESTEYPDIVSLAHWVLSKTYGGLAQIETRLEEKARFLQKALEHLNEDREFYEPQHFNYWDRGMMLVLSATLKAEQSILESDREKKKNILEEAVSDQERGVQLVIEECRKRAILERTWASPLVAIAPHQYRLGELLNRLYEVGRNKETQIKAIEAFEDSAESFQKIKMVSRVAECHWKVALIHDDAGAYLKAAENFVLASSNYGSAGEKIPQLKDFYNDHALYMQAWCEIEKARHHHERQEYGLAKEHFEKAANLHKSLKKWGYLRDNYSAWVQLENAEELSRKEQSEEAIRAFEEASKLFDETKKQLQAQLSKFEDKDEKQMANGVIRASELRREYCGGRIAVEEAKILDKTGDHFASSGKYGSAAEIFERISQNLELEQERREFRSFASLSRAWQKMMLADARASPELYSEASQLFEQASRESCIEKTGFQALGHSRFCLALEAGTRFADTRDKTAHTKAVQFLESAASYYDKAGIQEASEYAKSTGLLFDAYAHIDDAKREQDSEKKAKGYAIAEKILQTSAGSYLKAKHPEKRDQTLRLLERIREERELAVSITEVLHTPSIVSTTTSFTAPTPTSEEAVGSERFEHADVQANLLVRQKELKVGESVELEIEFVNAGKGPALLVKVTEVIPEGFEIVEKPETCRVEDSYIDMKGRRLDTLKTGELRLILKPKVQGTFALKPTLLYLDENGKYKSHELETVTILVKELGIKGWLKGER